MEYVTSKKEYWDYYSSVKTSYDKGRAEGREEGRAEGREEGRVERALEIARSLKGMGISMADIAKATGLSAEEIEIL